MLQLHVESFVGLRFCTKDHFYQEFLSRMIARFQKTGHLEVQELKPVRSDVIEGDATATVE